jgi:stage V sporulation protein B
LRFRKIFSISLGAQGAVLFIGFVNSVMITRYLGLEGRGQYAIAMNVITILALLLGDGLYRSNTYLVSVNAKYLSALFTNGVLAIGGFGSLLLIVSFIWGPHIIQTALPGLNMNILFWAVISMFPVIFVRSIEGLVLGLQRYFIFNGLVVLPLSIYLLFNIVLHFSEQYSPALLLRNYFASMGLVSILASLWLIRNETVRFRPDRAIAKESLSNGIKANISHLCLFMLFRVDIFLINYFLGTEQAGLYSIAVLISELLQKMANTSGTVLFPKVSGGSAKSGQTLSIRVLIFVLGAGLIFSLFFFLFGKALIILLFKEEFAPATPSLFYLLPGTVIMAGGKIVLFSLWGKGFPRITIIIPLAAFVLNTALNLALIPKLGIEGAAISTSMSYILFGAGLGVYFFSHPDMRNGRPSPVLEGAE